MLLGLLEGNKLNSGFVARSNGICRKGGWGGGGWCRAWELAGVPKGPQGCGTEPCAAGGTLCTAGAQL